MHISLEAIMSDYKEWQRKKAAMNGAIERYTEERMNDEHTDGSRSGGQPVLEPCPVPWCGSSDVKARSFDANHRRHWIECGKCNFKTPQMPSRTKVITLWNTRQPTRSNIFDASDVQKHTLIVEQDYASHTVKVKSLDDSQPTQSDAVQAEIETLRHDLERQMTIANEHVNEVERLREALKRIQHFSPAHMWRAPDIKVIVSAALEQSK